MLYFIGVDDTDKANTGGTGHNAIVLAQRLTAQGYGQITGITRHQLFVNDSISSASQNGAYCIALQSKNNNLISELKVICGAFLLQGKGEGSNPGLCIACAGLMQSGVEEFGMMAKSKFLSKNDAIMLSSKANINLTHHGGDGNGMIGALAAVGLRNSGKDGRFIWMRGMSEMRGVVAVSQIISLSGVRSVCNRDGEELNTSDKVDLGESFIPVMMNGLPTLLVEPVGKFAGSWRKVAEEYIVATC